MLDRLNRLSAVALDMFLSRIRHGHVTVVLPNDEVIQCGSDGPRVEVKINDWSVLRKLPLNASLAVGEGYMDGLVEINDLAAFFEIVNRNRLQATLPQLAFGMPKLRTRKEQISHHYDLSNEFFRLFLDEKTMMYSCAFFPRRNESLEQAQINKIHHSLAKLRLPKGSHIVEIGCGWGATAVAAARDYGYRVTAITLSEEQLKYARELAEREGVADMVKFEPKSFEELTGPYDGGISIGMYEHVGRDSHEAFFRKLKEILKPGAPFLLHTITSDRTNPVNAWTRKWIFPEGDLPTIDSVLRMEREFGMCPVDGFEPLREHYFLTLSHWIDNYEKNRKEIIDLMDEHPWVHRLGKDGAWFDRMWRFWLEGSRGGFGYGGLSVGQFLFVNGAPMPGELPLTRVA